MKQEMTVPGRTFLLRQADNINDQNMSCKGYPSGSPNCGLNVIVAARRYHSLLVAFGKL